MELVNIAGAIVTVFLVGEGAWSSLEKFRFKRRNLIILTAIVVAVTYASVLLHEGTHAAIAALLGLGIEGVGFSWLSFYVKIGRPLDQLALWQTLALCFPTPLIHLLLGRWLLKLAKKSKKMRKKAALRTSGRFQIGLGVLNYLPITGTDGWHILSSILGGGIARVVGLIFAGLLVLLVLLVAWDAWKGFKT